MKSRPCQPVFALENQCLSQFRRSTVGVTTAPSMLPPPWPWTVAPLPALAPALGNQIRCTPQDAQLRGHRGGAVTLIPSLASRISPLCPDALFFLSAVDSHTAIHDPALSTMRTCIHIYASHPCNLVHVSRFLWFAQSFRFGPVSASGALLLNPRPTTTQSRRSCQPVP